MKFISTNRKGFGIILMAIGVLTFLGILALSNNFQTLMHTRRATEKIFRSEGYYNSEFSVWNSYYREQDGLPMEGSADSKGRYVASFEAEYYKDLPDSMEPSEYEIDKYGDGHALNVKLTGYYDSARTVLAHNTRNLLRIRPKDPLGQYCGSSVFSRKGSEYKTCLWKVTPPVTSGPYKIVHVGSKFIDMRGHALGNTSGVLLGWKIGLQKDGKIVVVGGMNCSGHNSDVNQYGISKVANCYTWNLTRFNGDGTVDRSFGDHGLVETDLLRYATFPTDIAILNDGKILVAGHSTEAGKPKTWVVARYHADGNLDTSFGKGGVSLLVPPEATIYDLGPGSLQLTSDGKIILGGERDRDLVVTRLDANGQLDASFAKDGWAIYNLEVDSAGNKKTDFFRELILKKDGKIIVMGIIEPSGNSGNISLLQLNSNGSPDNSFGNQGIVKLEIPDRCAGGGIHCGRLEPYNLMLDSDEKIMLGGGAQLGLTDRRDYEFFLMKLLPSGNLDSSFGKGGIVLTNYEETKPVGGGTFYSNELMTALHITPDGKILTTGYTDATGGSADLIFIRYKEDGNLDASFGTAGKLSLKMVPDPIGNGGRSIPIDLIPTPDQKFVIAGNTGSLSTSYVARINVDGTYDNHFAKGGMIRHTFGFSRDAAFGVTFSPEGKPILGGHLMAGAGECNRLGLAKVNLDLSFDSSFGNKSESVCGTGQNSEGLPGRARPGVPYLEQANRDLPLIAKTVRVQSDGKIVAGGASKDQHHGRWMVARYNPDGSMDNSFGTGGVVPINFDSPLNANAKGPHAMLIQKDGKILLAGDNARMKSSESNFTLVRLHAGGAKDLEFGDSGMVTTSFVIEKKKTMGTIETLAIQSNGKIIAAGNLMEYPESTILGQGDLPNPWDFAVAKYNINGSLDETFGNKGIVLTDFYDLAEALNPISDQQRMYNSAMRNSKKATQDGIFSILLQEDEKILVGGCGGAGFAGSVGAPWPLQTALARYNPDGSLDSSFGKKGKVLIDLSEHLKKKFADYEVARNDCIHGLSWLPDGKFMALISTRGFITAPSGWGDGNDIPLDRNESSDIVLAVFNPDGTLDPTHGEKGILKTTLLRPNHPDPYFSVLTSLSISQAGYIAVAGYTVRSLNQVDMVLDLWRMVPL